MVKHIQTIWRQQPTNCLSVFDHVAGLVLKVLSKNIVDSPVALFAKIHFRRSFFNMKPSGHVQKKLIKKENLSI